MLSAPITVGVISDTHGLLRPEAVDVLRGSDYIIHSGDIGDPGILKELSAIAPVTPVRGNVDRAAWARRLPDWNVLQAGGLSIYVLHDVHQLDLKPAAAGFAAVVSGHSHVPRQQLRDGVLYFNPGSAGRKRFKLPVSVGKLRLESCRISAEIIRISD